MRPHTRTHCSRKGDCEQPGDGPHMEGVMSAPPCTSVGRGVAVNRGQVCAVHYQLYRPGQSNRHLSLVELPAEILIKILEYMSFKQNSTVRLVCRRLNELCAARLNSTFQRLQNQMLVRFQSIKSQMPRRESARRNHPLARECDIVETLHMRLTLLQMTFGKHIERKHICFFPGEILDEVFRILSYITCTQPLGRAYKVTDELFDLSTMAMEYFKENIEPSLPEITYFGSDFLDFTPPFSTPSKRLQLPNLAGQGVGFDSPISSRASAVGSSCSEPPLPYNHMDSVEGDYDEGSTVGRDPPAQSNMVLRKRIRRIRAGMKKYNTQLDEVKRELKSCKSKMDGQSKQVSEYASRLDDYDKKFEENSRKFGTLLTELNKCKTELQYYRSRSHLMQCLNCGSNLTDRTSESNNHLLVEEHEQSSNKPEDPACVFLEQDGLGALDKQAMVEDWLNPAMLLANGPASDSVDICAPQVQDFKQKISKTEDDPYQGPGSPGYTRSQSSSPRSGPDSPGPLSYNPASPSGGSRAGKRKSRDEKSGGQSGSSQCSKATRCKRPKLGNTN